MKKIILLILLLAPAFAWAGDSFKINAYSTIANELLKDCTGTDKAVAVAGFSYSDGRDSRDGGVVAERITTELVKLKKFKVIERKEIEKVFAELKFQRSGAITPDSAKEIGKLLGAEWMVVGTLTELPDKQLELNTRLVAVESGEILTAANTPIKKDWLDQYKRLLAEENVFIEKNPASPGTVEAFYKRGLTNTDLAEYNKAIADFGIVIANNPNYWEAYKHRGYVYYLKHEYDNAISDYEKLVAARTKTFHIGLNDSLMKNLNVLRGLAYFGKGDFDSAIADFDKDFEVNRQNAFNPSSYLNRGKAYIGKGEYDKAIEDFTRALELDPNDTKVYAARGGAYRKKGESDKAAADEEKANSLFKE